MKQKGVKKTKKQSLRKSTKTMVFKGRLIASQEDFSLSFSFVSDDITVSFITFGVKKTLN